MKLLKLIVRIVDTIVDYVGRVSSLGALMIMVVIIWEVVSRRFFNSPTIWAYELIIMTSAIYVIMITSYGLQKGSFVCVDVLSSKLPPRIARLVLLLTYFLFFLPFVGGILPSAFNFARTSILIGERSWSFWGQPVWPVKLALFVGLSFLLIKGISEMLKLVIWLVENWKTAALPKKEQEG